MGFFPAGVGGPKKVPLRMIAPRCDLCKYCKTAVNPKMGAIGSGKSKIMLIGDAPTTTGDISGKPISPNIVKEMITPILSKMGVSFADVVYVNALACKVDTKAGESDIGAAVDYCRPNVYDAIEKYKPKVIIPMGESAIRSVLAMYWTKDNNFSTSKWTGYQIPIGKLNAWICPTFSVNLAYTLKTADKDSPVRKSMVPAILFDRHLTNAVKLVDKVLPRPSKEDIRENVVVVSEKEAVRRLRQINQAESATIAFDFETTGLKPDRPYHQIICCSVFSFDEEGRAFVFDWTNATADALKKVLQNPKVGKIASNLKFETRWCLKMLKTRVANWAWDTMLAAHLIDAREGASPSIKFLAFAMLGVSPWDDHISPYLDSGSGGANGINKIKSIDRRELLIYCGIDSYLEYMVALMQSHIMNIPLWDHRGSNA